MAKTNETATETTMRDVKRRVLLRGLRPLMFDPYPGDNDTSLEAKDKMYFAPDGRSLVLPCENIMSLLTAENTPSAPKRFLDSRKYKKVAAALQSYTMIDPMRIPLTRNGKQIVFHGFENGRDDEGGIYIANNTARLKNGIPNPKVRPVVELPWELEFTVTFFENTEVKESVLRDMLNRGGVAIGLGTYRGVYGKFSLEVWE